MYKMVPWHPSFHLCFKQVSIPPTFDILKCSFVKMTAPMWHIFILTVGKSGVFLS